MPFGSPPGTPPWLTTFLSQMQGDAAGKSGQKWQDPNGRQWRSQGVPYTDGTDPGTALIFQVQAGTKWKTIAALTSAGNLYVLGSVTGSHTFSGSLEPQ